MNNTASAISIAAALGVGSTFGYQAAKPTPPTVIAASAACRTQVTEDYHGVKFEQVVCGDVALSQVDSARLLKLKDSAGRLVIMDDELRALGVIR
jgi:hypothetical protein